MLCVFTVEVVLKKRLTDLEACMKLLLKNATPSSIHDLRVASRRTDAAIFLCQDALRDDVEAFFARKCRQVRAHTNRIRNLDVLLAWLGTAEVRSKKSLKKRRSLASHKLVKTVAHWLEGNEIAKHRQAAVQLERFTIEQKVAARMVQLGGQYVKAAANGLIREDGLHGWRVATKRLRYAFEFLQMCNCNVKLDETLESLERQQDELGKRTDAMVRRSLRAGESAESSSLEFAENSFWLTETTKFFLKVVEVAHWCIDSEWVDASIQSGFSMPRMKVH